MSEEKEAVEVVEQVEQPAVEEVVAAESSWEEVAESEDAPAEEVAEEPEEEELELYLGDEKLDAPASEDEEKKPDLVKTLRHEIQERNKRIRELEAAAPAQPAVKPDEPLAIPTLDGADYDDEKYQAQLIEYFGKKAQQDKAKAEQEQQQKQWMETHNQKLATYNERKAALKVKDFAEVERVVLEEVPENVQGVILHYAKTPEVVVLAAGRNEAIRKQLAETKDPVALGILIGNIEAKAKLLPKGKTDKPAPAPSVKGNAGAGKQTVEDAAFRKQFPGGTIL